MAIAKSFRDLDVYKLARIEAGKIFELTKTFPKEERYALVDQVRRSSRAVGAMIGAAWARRRWSNADTIDAAVELRHGRSSTLDASEVDKLLDHVECLLVQSE